VADVEPVPGTQIVQIAKNKASERAGKNEGRRKIVELASGINSAV